MPSAGLLYFMKLPSEVSGNVVVLLADIVGLVVADGAAIAVLEAVSWQHHEGPIHAGNNMIWNH